MPILPWLTDSEEHLDALFGALASAGATGVTAGALHLRPGTKEWFMQWLGHEHPHLVGRYTRLYGQGTYAPKEYRTWLAQRVNAAKRRHRFQGQESFAHRMGAADAAGETPASGTTTGPRDRTVQEQLF
jgi:DNA repair photolyase